MKTEATPLAAAAAAIAPVPTPAPVAASAAFPWLHIGIVLLAAVLRLWDLDLRPPHFDEGVNGWFTDQMQTWGCYRYDPSNYHGPLHFYALFLFKVLFGRHLWALRLPVVIVGVLTVDWTLRFERFLGRRTCVWAALAMTVSPGFLYYQRDAIHETWLAFFLVLGFWGLFGLWQEGGKRYLWAVGMALTGAILTKETYLIHVGCLVLAVPCLIVLESFAPSVRTIFARREGGAEPPPEDRSAPPPLFDEVPPWSSPVWKSFAPQSWREQDAWTVVVVSLLLILFFYSGNGFHLEGVRGLFTAFKFWGHKSQVGEGHNKPFLYWSRLLLHNEPFALLGMLASFYFITPPLPASRFTSGPWVKWAGAALALAGIIGFAYLTQRYPEHQGIPGTDSPTRMNSSLYLALWGLSLAALALGVACLRLPPPTDWRLRFLAIYGLGNFVAYSLIPYKTPWCAISFAWPFFFPAGAWLSHFSDCAAQFSREGQDRRAAFVRARLWIGGAALLGYSTFLAVRLNYFRPTAETGEDYVYVQTFPDMWKITEPMLKLARKDPRAYHLSGDILCDSTYPLPWVLGDFTGIGYYANEVQPTEYRADFLLVIDTRVAEAESHLDTDYFKETVHLRGAQGALNLYFRASRFAKIFPGRQPEFRRQKPPSPPRQKRRPPVRVFVGPHAR